MRPLFKDPKKSPSIKSVETAFFYQREHVGGKIQGVKSDRRTSVVLKSLRLSASPEAAPALPRARATAAKRLAWDLTPHALCGSRGRAQSVSGAAPGHTREWPRRWWGGGVVLGGDAPKPPGAVREKGPPTKDITAISASETHY